jgi:hypothetical protein
MSVVASAILAHHNVRAATKLARHTASSGFRLARRRDTSFSVGEDRARPIYSVPLEDAPAASPPNQ